MISRVVPGQLITERDAAGIARVATAQIAAALKSALEARSGATIALSGGNTPRGTYAALAGSGVDWSRVQVFWVDERAVPPTHDRSNYRLAKATLLDSAGVAPDHVHRMPADAPDAETAARAYEKALLDDVARDADGVPAFDVIVLGVGDDGHTASLFPGEPGIDVIDRFVISVAARPDREARLTLTRPVIEHARSVFILAAGAGKRPALERVWATEGDVHKTPSRIVRECKGRVVWIVDDAAASGP
jgi:6-phosphogluconolactonase